MKSPVVIRTVNVLYLLIVLTSVKYEAFALHPISMALLWTLLCEAVYQVKISKTVHKKIMSLAAIVASFGITAIYYLKENHLQSLHGKLGFTAVLFLIGQALLASIIHGKVKASAIWKIHATYGMILFLGIGVISWLQIGHKDGWLFQEHHGGLHAITGRLILTISIIINALG